MPYTNIHWIKLEKRLLNDPRFFLMSEKAQLFYIKLLLLCALYENKVSRKYEILRELLRTRNSEEELNHTFEEIKANFPKVLLHKDFYYIKGFKEHHNWVVPKELPENSEGTPKDAPIKINKEQLNKIRLEYIRLKGWNEKDLQSDDYARIHHAIKQLIVKAKTDELCVSAMQWVSQQKYCDWTMETVVKKYPEFKKQKQHQGVIKQRDNEALEKIKQWEREKEERLSGEIK